MPGDEEGRPATTPDGLTATGSSTDSSLRDNGPVRLPAAVEADLSRFAVRMLEDAITEAMPWHWTRRAEQLESARPLPGDYRGQATAEDLAERHERLTEQADACRRHAEFLRDYPSPLTEFERSVVVAIVKGVAA